MASSIGSTHVIMAVNEVRLVRRRQSCHSRLQYFPSVHLLLLVLLIEERAELVDDVGAIVDDGIAFGSLEVIGRVQPCYEQCTLPA